MFSSSALKAALGSLLAIATTALATAQKSPFEGDNDAEFFVMLDSYAKYGGEIKVIDGLTGNKYSSANEVVIAFHSNMPKIMGGFHGMLLDYESKHINFRIKDGNEHEQELAALAETFGIKGFRVDKETFLSRERAIYTRLRNEPFFKLDELVVWELEYLEPTLPDTPYAKNIRYDWETKTWHRRALTKWNVIIPRNNHTQFVEKFQGLDLDTQHGFHEIENGLPHFVHSSNFKEVKLSYPIFVDPKKDPQEQIEYLQQSFIKNLRHLYDPFSWVARRSNRFKTGYATELAEHIKGRSFKVRNREWFDRVLAHFLNDVIIIRRHGYQPIYKEVASQSAKTQYQNQLGDDLDLLNWGPKEKRVVKGKGGNRWNPINKNSEFESAGAARYIMLDAYLRKGDEFLDALRIALLEQKSKTEPVPLFEEVLAKTSGIPADKYIELAFKEQRKLIVDFQEKVLEKLQNK